MKTEILELLQEASDTRYKLVEEAMNLAKTRDDKIDIIYKLTELELLPHGNWMDEAPEWVQVVWQEFDNRRGQIMYYEAALDWDIHDVTDAQVDELFEYVKEHKILGTKYDW